MLELHVSYTEFPELLPLLQDTESLDTIRNPSIRLGVVIIWLEKMHHLVEEDVTFEMLLSFVLEIYCSRNKKDMR